MSELGNFGDVFAKFHAGGASIRLFSHLSRRTHAPDMPKGRRIHNAIRLPATGLEDEAGRCSQISANKYQRLLFCRNRLQSANVTM
jgi:hypothetical protein